MKLGKSRHASKGTYLHQIIQMNRFFPNRSRALGRLLILPAQTFGAVYTDKPGQPPLPTRLMAGLAILKHTYDLSDEALCDRWVGVRWLRLSEQNFRVDKWSLCRG